MESEGPAVVASPVTFEQYIEMVGPIWKLCCDFLYPQYERTMNVISPGQWTWIQAEAARKYAEDVERGFMATEAVRSHWLSIINGNVPFGMTVRE